MDLVKPSSERVGNIPLQGKQGRSRRAVLGKAPEGEIGLFEKMFSARTSTGMNG